MRWPTRRGLRNTCRAAVETQAFPRGVSVPATFHWRQTSASGTPAWSFRTPSRIALASFGSRLRRSSCQPNGCQAKIGRPSWATSRWLRATGRAVSRLALLAKATHDAGHRDPIVRAEVEVAGDRGEDGLAP